MKTRHLIAASALLLGSRLALADTCSVSVEGNDLMQYQERQLSVSATCTEVEVTLKHVGTQPAKVMGHDWVLARTADYVAVANAGLAAGPAHNYQPTGDKRVLAATRVIGGGESTTVKFSTAALQPGGDYTFFCSSPGHWSVMKGRFLFGERGDRVAARPAH
jgi:azurin